MKELHIGESFTLRVTIGKRDQARLEELLRDNKICYTKHPNIILSFVEFKISNCSLKRAETIRQLIKHIYTYD